MTTLNGGGTRVLVETGPEELRERFVAYLLRLGCTVTARGGDAFDVCVMFSETVEDEAAAIAEWCTSWSQTHASSCIVHDALRTTASARSD